MCWPLDDNLAVLVANRVGGEDGFYRDDCFLYKTPDFGVSLVANTIVQKDRVRGEWFQHVIRIQAGIGVDIVGNGFG